MFQVYSKMSFLAVNSQAMNFFIVFLFLALLVDIRAFTVQKPGLGKIVDRRNTLQEGLKSSSGNWSYEDVDHWPYVYPYCGGSFQSPIVLDPVATVNYDVLPLEFINYDVPAYADLRNTGESVQLKLYASVVPSISGGGLIGTYLFSQLHFHWGSSSSQGSEHVKGSERFAAEVHFVHYNSKYGSFDEALQYADGVAVLGLFVQEGHSENRPYRPITDALASIRNPGSMVALPGEMALSDFLPNDVHRFFRYFGSLTTPACNEVVTWTVFNAPVSLSSSQMNEFRQLMNSEHLPLVDNFRPTQALNDRLIYARGF